MAYFVLVFIISTAFIDFLKSKFSFLKPENVCLFIAILFLFIFSLNAWKINIYTVSGIYFAGLFLSKSDYRESVEETIKISQLIFVPFFFIFLGSGLDMKIFDFKYLPFIILYFITAITGKIFGCGIIAKIFGFDFKRSFRIGCGMSPRGEIALIIAAVAFYYSGVKYLKEIDFITVIIMVTASILIIQYLMMFLFRDKHIITGDRHDIKTN